MAEPGYTHHLIVLHPTQTRVLMVETENGWQLPKLSPEEGFFPLTEEITRFTQMTLDLESVVLRPVHYWKSEAEDHFDTLYLCEAHTLPESFSGRWFGLEELDADSFEQPRYKPFVLTALREDAGQESIPEQRPAWARRGWWKGAEVWLREELAKLGYSEVGRLEQMKQWGISSVGRVMTDKGLLYFKALPPIFAHEAEVTLALTRLFPRNLPSVVTSRPEEGWFVTADFGTCHPDETARKGAIRRYAEIQIEALDHLPVLLKSGCEARPLTALGEVFDALLEHPEVQAGLAPEALELLRASRPALLAALSELAACGLPETLMHGDFHYGNVVVQEDTCILFDWTDACITHPFLDVAHIVSYYEEPEAEELAAAYLEPWRRAFPAAQVGRAFDLAEVVMPVFFAQTHVRIVASLEPGSKWEFEGEAAAYLRKLAARLKTKGE